ncbi:MAG: hypothetical protein IH942_04145 [Acidobacteria bacterium]|nr:hypothetical protein [Acidobacteriota bacterium]
MTTTFTGEVRIPGAIENGLPSTITLDAQTLILTAGGTELGRWNRTDLALSRDPDGTFRLTLGTEIVLFNPDSPLEFAILSGMPATASPPVGTPSGPAIPTSAPVADPPPAATTEAPPLASAPSPATPPPGAAPPLAPADPPAVAPPAAAPPPAVAIPPAAAVPPAPAASPSPAIPVPTGAAPATPVPPVAATPPPATPPTPAAPPGAAPPAAATPTAQPPPDVVAAGAAAAAAARATVPGQPAAPGATADIRLETDSGQEAAPAAPSPQPTEFWDGFHAEADEAAGGSKSDTHPAEGVVADTSGSEFHLESAAEDGDEEATSDPKVTGYGSGLFTEDDETPSEYPPAFEGAGEEAGEERAWSYDDPAPHDPESPDPTPAFTSPAADREDLVPSSGKSGIAALLAWRPSMPGRPSFSFGASGIGMRAREALSVLDSILEENGTEDIPKGLIVGLFVFVGLLALVAVVVAIL